MSHTNPVHTLSHYLLIVDISRFLPFALQFQTSLFNLGFQNATLLACLISRYMKYFSHSYPLCKLLNYICRIVGYTVMHAAVHDIVQIFDCLNKYYFSKKKNTDIYRIHFLYQ